MSWNGWALQSCSARLEVAAVSEEALVRRSSVPYRQVALSQPDVDVCERGGNLYLVSKEPLEKTPASILDRLIRWSKERGEQTFVARRSCRGQWQRISYREMLQRVRLLAAHLNQYHLSPQRPLVILSGNDLEHLQLAFAAMYIGVPYCPVSPAYSLVAKDFRKLRHIFDVLQPGLVMAADGLAFEKAIAAVVPAETPLLVVEGEVSGRSYRTFNSLLDPISTVSADQAYAQTGPDTIAKFLFTSGSTKLPKAVVTTQRMLCTNQQMLLQTFPEFAHEPPVLVDWLPWNHTFGGSHNIGIVLYNGGTLYLDDGRPTPQLFHETLRNLKEVSPTAYLTVPKGWEELVNALEQDVQLRESFFLRMKLFFFAGAGLGESVWARLDRVAEQHCGARIRMMASLGMTETAPSCTFTTGPLSMAGYVGLPAPGCEIKLAPVEGKLEARFRGPHVMPGYWRQEDLNQLAFDDEGYYCSGDALRFADLAHPEWGLMFDGRIAEDFKLSNGVFVSVGPLRARVLQLGAPYVQDVVVTGPDRRQLGLLIFPNVTACRELAGMPLSVEPCDVLSAMAVQDWLRGLLLGLNKDATGISSQIAWACLMAEAPSVEAGELTDKGSLNQRVVLDRRSSVIDALYSESHPLCVHVEVGN